tara:strand:- start:723 stop:1241 length:519 start_codon:yes stop_codon:yes gene_type:complete
MNIFYLDSDPVKAAQAQYNKHVVKMILESAQMLCTAHHHYDNGHNVPYKKAHYNHPSTIWCRQNSRQYYWLFHHMIALGDEYTKRYNKKHLSITKCFDVLKDCPVGMPLGGEFNEPPQCMPEQYKVPGCSVTAYWNYYEREKHTVANKNEELKFRPDEYINIHFSNSNYIPC